MGSHITVQSHLEIFSLTEKNVEECAARAAEILRAGGVVLYPTDTLYGLGADAFSDSAVDKIRSIKSREEGKPVHCVVESVAMAERYAVLPREARMLAKVFWPGPLTLVVPKKANVHAGVGRSIGTIGFRIPKGEFCIELARAFGKPYTTTSANVSGSEPPRSIEMILAQLGAPAADIDLAVDAGELPHSGPSTVVRIDEAGTIVLREGIIAAADIFDVLGKLSRERNGL